MRNLFFLFGFLLFWTSAFAQPTAELDGYIYEAGNRGYLNQVKIRVYEMPDKIVRDELVTDTDGHFSAALEEGKTYQILCLKDIFHDWDTTFTAVAGKNFYKVEMHRKPGYLFDVTLAEPRSSEDVIVDAVEGATIEIYNRTQKKSEMVLKDHPKPYFQFTFEQGNYYTIMIRKIGYLTKRIEAHVNIDGCIICIDGVSNLRPGVTENLTEHNTMGTLLANIEVERASLDKKIGIQNIYYDLNKWDIKPAASKELDKVVLLMRDNPSLTIELGSHTDARGSDESNLELSQKRAEAAVAYILQKGVSNDRITAKGFGETDLINRCSNGVNCPDVEHALNRRTELRITGFDLDSLAKMRWHSLEQIIREEDFEKMVLELDNPTQIKIGADGKPMQDRITYDQQGTTTTTSEIRIPVQTETNRSQQMQVEQVKTVVETQQRVESVIVQAEESIEPETAASGKVSYLPANFSGHNIFIASSKRIMASENQIFDPFSQVFVRKNEVTNLYEYYVGNFATKVKAQSFLETVVTPHFSTAQLMHFENGQAVE